MCVCVINADIVLAYANSYAYTIYKGKRHMLAARYSQCCWNRCCCFCCCCCCHHWLCLHMYRYTNVSPTLKCLLHDYSLEFFFNPRTHQSRHTDTCTHTRARTNQNKHNFRMTFGLFCIFISFPVIKRKVANSIDWLRPLVVVFDSFIWTNSGPIFRWYESLGITD